MYLEIWKGYPKMAPSSESKILNMTTNLYKGKYVVIGTNSNEIFWLNIQTQIKVL